MNTNEKRTAYIGAAVLILIIVGLALWYMAKTPPPEHVQSPISGPIAPGSYRKDVIEDSGQYHTAVAAYPLETPLRETANASADQAAVSLLKSFIESHIAEFKLNSGLETLTAEDIAMMGLSEEHKYALEMDFEVSDAPKTISYVYTIYEDTLGAHPNGYFRTFTFDKTTGSVVTLNDLFTGNYLHRLSDIARERLPGIISDKSGGLEPDLEYIDSGTTATAESFQFFAIDGTTFVMIFPPYQVGPYAIGTQFVEVPMSELGDILNEAYRL